MKKIKTYTKKEILTYFEYFKKNIPNSLKYAKKALNKSELDFSMEEIDRIGIIYKEYVESNNNTFKLYDKTFKKYMYYYGEVDWYDETLEMFMTYCGEAWINYFGGEWDIITQRNNTIYRFPIIIKWGPKEYPWSSINPIDWARQIKQGDKEPLSLPWQRKLNYFRLSPEWNFKPINKIKNE